MNSGPGKSALQNHLNIDQHTWFQKQKEVTGQTALNIIPHTEVYL